MKHEIVFPEFAEDGDEKAKVVAWNIKIGETVEEGDDIVELLTDKATFTVPAPATGKLTQITKELDTEVSVGEVLGILEE